MQIEQNTLSLEQVTAVLSGKRVLAPPKDIAEVKNAYEIYDHLNELNPYSVEDLLLAHHVMMRGLVQEDGVFRSKPVGVVDSHGNVTSFWNTTAVCASSGGRTAQMDRGQPASDADQKLRVSL